MTTTPAPIQLIAHVSDIDHVAGVFYARIEADATQGLYEDVDATLAIKDLNPTELPFLRPGAIFTLCPTAKPGQRVVFSRRTWTEEDVARAKQEAQELLALFENNRLQFPFVNKQVEVTDDSDSFLQVNLDKTIQIPVGNHVGAFGVTRKHHQHEGVDLYAPPDTTVVAMEDGKVVMIGPFTGPAAGMPWWLDTEVVMVEGESGVIAYGELRASVGLQVGDTVRARGEIGHLTPVLAHDKGRPRTMLHMELYEHGIYQSCGIWPLGAERPRGLLDPTPLLLKAAKLSRS